MIISPLAFKLDQDSLTRMEDLLISIHREVKMGMNLWIALQTNCLKELNAGFPSNWEEMVRNSQLRLEKEGFYLPILNYNLRNSSEVYTMVEAIKPERQGTEVKDSLGIPTISMTIHATMPQVIPILFEEWKQRIGEAILFSIEKTKEETKQKDASFVIMHDVNFKTDEIHDCLVKKVANKQLVYKYPPNENDKDPSIKYLDDLMENKKQGYLILKDKGFKGSEAQNVILINDSTTSSLSDVRCNMLRCISNLAIIPVVGEVERIHLERLS